MKKITYLTLVSLIAISFASCKKVSSADITITNPGGTDPVSPTYYINFKADGVAVSETEVSATRGATSSPRTLTISGTTKSGAVPTFKFYTQETIAGFSPGLTEGTSVNSYPSSYVEFTNSSNVLYSSKISSKLLSFSFLSISYANGGVISGVFSGTLVTDKGVAVQITEGTYNVKCSN